MHRSPWRSILHIVFLFFSTLDCSHQHSQYSSGSEEHIPPLHSYPVAMVFFANVGELVFDEKCGLVFELGGGWGEFG